MLSRRAFIATALLLLVTQASRADEKLTYRDFTIDMSVAATMANRAAIETALKKQIDIVADCGAKDDILAFFRAQKISLKTNGNDGGGRFSPGGGVEIQAAQLPPEKPILLHELLHAMHARYLPNSVRNADVLRFYHNAQRGQVYPAREYVMKNVNEFFAVTASLYLWGYVARSPNNRETLRTKQPYYYAWLGDLFSVKK